jgi:hypothetical protein
MAEAMAAVACLRTVPGGSPALGMRLSSKPHHHHHHQHHHHQHANQNQNQNQNRNRNRKSSGLKLTGCRAALSSSSSAKTRSKAEAVTTTTVELVASVRILREGLLDVASHAISDFFRQQKTTVYLVSLDSLDPGPSTRLSFTPYHI